jgi:hypothetical protein
MTRTHKRDGGRTMTQRRVHTSLAESHLLPSRKQSGTKHVLKRPENKIVWVRGGYGARLVGFSRPTFNHRQHPAQRLRGHSLLVLNRVLALRRELSGLGTRIVQGLLGQA